MALDLDRMDELARAQATVADKIRALDAAGVPRADIARFLGKRYQHVRNVLEGDAQSGGYVLGKADLSGVQEGSSPFEAGPDETELIEQRGPGTYWLRPHPDGSLLLPREVLDALDVSGGQRLLAKLVGDELHIVNAETSMKRARALVRQFAKAKPGSVVDEFLAERRSMWGEEDG